MAVAQYVVAQLEDIKTLQHQYLAAVQQQFPARGSIKYVITIIIIILFFLFYFFFFYLMTSFQAKQKGSRSAGFQSKLEMISTIDGLAIENCLSSVCLKGG